MADSTVNPGTSRTLVTQTTVNDSSARNAINQLRGTDPKGSLGSAIPKQVTNVGAAISNGQVGTTSTVRVTFHRDPSDKNYSAASIWVKGYQGNSTPVQVAQSYESPATFVLNNTGEPVSILVQSTGNGGQAPLSSAPTTGITLPKSTTGGYSTQTITTYNVSNPPPAPATATADYMLGPGILNLGQAQASASVTLSGISPTLRVVSVCRFFLPAAISGFTKLDGSFSCNLGPGSHFAVGFYDTSGNKLWDSGALAVPNVVNTSISFTVPSLSLAIGTYYYAWTADDNGNTATWVDIGLRTLLFNASTTNGNVVNQGTVRAGTAANAATAGPALPSTLGAISVPGSSFVIPLVLFR
jgi:hypothetical protein